MIGAIVGSSLLGAASSSRAARAQESAASRDIEFQRESLETMRQDAAPFRDAGLTAQDAYMFNLGLRDAPMIGGTPMEVIEVPGASGGLGGVPGPAIGGMFLGGTHTIGGSNDGPMRAADPMRPSPSTFRVGDRSFATREEAQAFANANRTGGRAYGGFQASPGFEFAFDQGTRAVNALAGARGGRVSGRTMQDLTSFGQGLANQEFNTYMNRLAGLTDQGLSAATMQANAANSAAGRVSNALGAAGNASAAGAIGMGNALQGGVQNYLSWQGYQAGRAPQWQPNPATPTMRPQPRPF